MKFIHHPINKPILISIFIWTMLQLLYTSTIERYEFKNIISKSTHWPDMFPAGEITAGFNLRQKITIEQSDVQPNDFQASICLEIQFANYGNRSNKGEFEIRVITENMTQTKKIEANLIQDNAFEAVCFDKIPFAQIHKKEAWLEISGIDGKPKQSVTAMLSSFQKGNRTEIQGKTTPSTLVYQASIRKDSGIYRLNAHMLIIFTTLVITTMLFAWAPRPENQTNPSQ